VQESLDEITELKTMMGTFEKSSDMNKLSTQKNSAVHEHTAQMR
jgi:hypothetical protein